MLHPELSPLLVSGIAEAVGRSPDLPTAFASLTDELFRLVGTRATVIERHDGKWASSAGQLNSGVPVPDFTFRDSRVIRLGREGGAAATVVSLSVSDEHDLALVLEGDWTGAQESLTVWSLVLSHALRLVREHEVTQSAEKLLVRGYAMARRLGRLGDVSAIASRIVAHVAHMLDAERVSLALHSNDDYLLRIVATHGYPLASVEEVRIKPGEWVIGHVYSSRRPVFVRDVRLLSTTRGPSNRYRSFSFAAVPMTAGLETVGVLTVTDKRDGKPFDRQDEIALRAIGVWAGTALAAARVETEAARLAYAATIDSLTGLLNRAYLDSRLHQEVERAKREGGTLAVLIADIDNFKTINDTFGHQTGDAVLKRVGSVIRSAVRVFDVCARYGGDEFAIVMPNSDRASALACAERIRRRLLESRPAENDTPLTMSIGVAVFAPDDGAADLIVRADRCMYRAKADGKNLVRAQGEWLDDSLNPELMGAAAGQRPIVSPSTAHGGGTAGEGTPVDLKYVLVADANQERAAFCHETVSGAGLGLLIARDGDQAVRAIERFGPPHVLIVDLALPGKDGFAVIDAVRSEERRQPEIVAWAASREMREYAAARLSGLHAHVISDTAPRATMRAAIAHALKPRAAASAFGSVAPPGAEHEDLEQRRRVNELSNRARQLCGTAGVAVYMRASADAKFRATFAWSSDEMMPHSSHHLPRAFEQITATGESICWKDLASPTPAGDEARDAVRGLAGVPIVVGGEVLGALCVFDNKPLQISEHELSSLKLLGHVTLDVTNVLLAGSSMPAFRDRSGDRTAERPGDRAGDRAADRPGDRAGDRAAERTGNRAGDRAGDRVSDRDPGGSHANHEPVIHNPSVDWPPALLERQGGEFAVARELARARREGHQLSVILFDCASMEPAEAAVDDALLERVTDTLLRAIRQSDLPIRWSGRELLVVLPGLADHQARTVAERVRAALHAGVRHRLAISGGVAELKPDERFGDVVDRARNKVAMARGRGHNRVI